MIRDEALRLERLVEDLRTLSLADGGEMTLTPEPTPPIALLEQASKAHRPQAEQKGIMLTFEADPDLPAVMVDPDRMAQVLGNLIHNSLRHTPPGGRVLLAAIKVEGAVRFRVEDTGPGIDPEDLHRVFERLYRTDKSRQRDGGGSGLGLAIARSIVVGHAGKIWAESKPGEGATIVVEMPTGTRSEGSCTCRASRCPRRPRRWVCPDALHPWPHPEGPVESHLNFTFRGPKCRKMAQWEGHSGRIASRG